RIILSMPGGAVCAGAEAGVPEEIDEGICYSFHLGQLALAQRSVHPVFIFRPVRLYAGRLRRGDGNISRGDRLTGKDTRNSLKRRVIEKNKSARGREDR